MKKKFSSAFIWVLLVLFLPVLCLAEGAAVLISLKGSVMISENGKDSWEKAVSGMSIPEGFYIKVGKQSEAALMLKDRSQIRLWDDSVLCLKKSGSAPGEKEQKKGLLHFLKGQFWMRNKRRVIKPDINTASLNMSIKGTELKVEVNENTSETRVTALEGKILCENASGATIITRGIEAVAKQNEKIQTHTLINPETSVQWLLITPDVVGPADLFTLTATQKRSVELSRSAMRLLAKNQIQKAYETALEAVRLSPETASANIAMATVLQTRGEFDAALIYAHKGLKTDPYSEPALLRVAELLLGQNKIQPANRLIKQFKGERTGLFHMISGFIFLIKHDNVQAEKSFHTALSMEKDLSRAWVGLGLALYGQGMVSEGLQKLEIASLLNPLSAFPHNYLGKALYEAKEYDETEVEFRRASQLDPNDPTPYLYMAIMAQDNFLPAESIRHLKKAIEMNDNLFISRSRFLLDMDRSIKNINLAKALSSLGLNEWAHHMGNRAIWQDNTNSSAYLFRASEALSLSRVDVATLSDLKRAQLLNPVNSNTFPSYTDYYSLLERPKHLQILEGYAATDETFGATVTARGGQNNHAYLASAHMDTTDGPYNHTGESGRYLDLQYKTEPVFTHQFTLGFTWGEEDHQDARPLQNGFATANDDEAENDYYQVNAGYHWNASANQDLLVSLQYQDRSSDNFNKRFFELVPNIWYNWANSLNQDDKRYRAEIIDIIAYNNHAITIGGSFGKLERDVTNSQVIMPGNNTNIIVDQQTHTAQPEETEIQIFAKDVWTLSKNMMLDLSLGWGQFDADNKKDIRHFLPQIGAMMEVKKNNLIRAAFFKQIQPDYLSATLQPVEVAGFSTITGVPSGTLTESYGLAFDRQLGSRYFASIEAQFKRKQYNTPYRPHPDLKKSWDQEDTRSLGLTLNYLISDQYALSLTQRFTDIAPETPGLDRLDSETGLRFTCVYPFGLTLGTAWWWVDQTFDSANTAGIKGNNFIMGSLSARQSLFDKKMEIFFSLDNILDQSFSYVPEESIAGRDLPWQGIFFLAGFRVKF